MGKKRCSRLEKVTRNVNHHPSRWRAGFVQVTKYLPWTFVHIKYIDNIAVFARRLSGALMAKPGNMIVKFVSVLVSFGSAAASAIQLPLQKSSIAHRLHSKTWCNEGRELKKVVHGDVVRNTG